MICVDIETKQVTNLNQGINELNTINCLRIENDWISASVSGYNRQPTLALGKLPERGNESEFSWHFSELTSTDKTREIIESTNVELLTFVPKIIDPVYRKQSFDFYLVRCLNDTKFIFLNLANLTYESVLLKPKVQNKILVVLPHGNNKNK